MTETGGKTRVAILISGRGSNMVALIEAARAPDFPARIVLVVSNRPDAAGLARARDAGIPTQVVDHTTFSSREAFDAALQLKLVDENVDFVCLAGFMRIFSAGFVETWTGRMLNIHPSLLPLFRGTHTHAQALAAGVRLHGCTVHYVIPELDAGPIVAQAAIPVRPGDDPDSLADRVITEERRLYPKALALVASGRARLESDRVRFAEDLSREQDSLHSL